MKKVIIFDMDGVLIDSEPEYLKMNEKLFKGLGVDMQRDNYHTFVGMSSKKMWTLIRNDFNLSYNVDELMEMEKNSMFEILNSAVIRNPIDGITALLNTLIRKNYILSVASSSARKNIDLVLNRFNLKKYFKFVISGEDIKNGKPEPDIFNKVAEKFTTLPDKCFVIEDSANGVTAAKKAGMKCIGFKNALSSQDLSKADLIVDNFNNESRKEIINFIEAS